MDGAKVYVTDKDGQWVRGTVVAALGSNKFRVQQEPWEREAVEGEVEIDASKMEDGNLPMQNKDMPENGFPDMTKLDHLHEAALLHNLRARFFANGCPYTYTADIVIAVNPYRWFDNLFTDERRQLYSVADRSHLDPHVYNTSAAAYFNLKARGMDQSILVSGESGAGKTETVKILMKHLAYIASSENQSHIDRIVKSNPLLEAFGNAQTVRNDNSSRFGKFIELQLDDKAQLVGSKARTYLLEKSRIVGQDPGERSYHIFYQMLAADASARAAFGLGDASRTRDTMRYTSGGKSKTDKIEGKTDAQCFAHTIEALALVGVVDEILAELWRALAGVLLVGQVEYEGTDTSKVTAGTAAEVEAAASLFSVDKSALDKALTKRTIKTRNEKVVTALDGTTALATRDALAKAVYGRIFDWLVAKICAATGASGTTTQFVGMLDIFGFESFAINRFEQLCINYANEKLQQRFTQDVFKAVQQEYAEEGIPWESIEYADNQPVLNLIEAKLGIVAMLNEEGKVAQGSDEKFVNKLGSVFGEDPNFSKPKVGKDKEVQFSIKHYAGSVLYTATGWLERNKDAVSDDVIQLLAESGNSILAECFKEPEEQADLAPGAKSSQGKATVVTKFRNSLAELMQTVSSTEVQYVRCIKPNKNKSASEVNNAMVVDQLRCAGVIEAIKVCRAGFPARMPLKEFIQRFRILRPKGKSLPKDDLREACNIMVAEVLPPAGADGKKQFEIGKTRMYFKQGVLEKLEEKRSFHRQQAASMITRCVRGFQARQHFKNVRLIIIRVQAWWRMCRQFKAFMKTYEATIRIQATWRGVLARRVALAMLRERKATLIQATWRMHKNVVRFETKRKSAIKIQARARRNQCRKKYLAEQEARKEQAKLDNQVKALQAKLEAQEEAQKQAQEERLAREAREREEFEEKQKAAMEALEAKLEAQERAAKEAMQAKLEAESKAALEAQQKEAMDALQAKLDTKDREAFEEMQAKLAEKEKAAQEAQEKASAALKDAHEREMEEWERKHRTEIEQLQAKLDAQRSDSGAGTGEASAEMLEALNKLSSESAKLRSERDDHLEQIQKLTDRLQEQGDNEILHAQIHQLKMQIQQLKEDNERLSDEVVAAREERRTANTGRRTSFEIETELRAQFAEELQAAREQWEQDTVQDTAARPRTSISSGSRPSMPSMQGSATAAAAKASRAAAMFKDKAKTPNLTTMNTKMKKVMPSKFPYKPNMRQSGAKGLGDPGNPAADSQHAQRTEEVSIVVEEKDLGANWSADLPFRVESFRLVQQDGGSPELGPLERFGKISPGDVLKSVNDMDVSDFPHIAITGLLNRERPVTLVFSKPAAAILNYDVVVDEVQLGGVFSNDLPVRVLRFRSVDGEIGPLERSGKVLAGDILMKINGKDITGIPVSTVMQVLRTPRRPMTLSLMRTGEPEEDAGGNPSAASAAASSSSAAVALQRRSINVAPAAANKAAALMKNEANMASIKAKKSVVLAGNLAANAMAGAAKKATNMKSSTGPDENSTSKRSSFSSVFSKRSSKS